jgi:hypothetical protein
MRIGVQQLVAMALHMQGWVVEKTIMWVVEASCKKHGVVVGNYNAQGKDVMVMVEYIELVVMVGLDARCKVVMVTEEMEIDMGVNEKGNEGALEVEMAIGHNEDLSVVVKSPAEKSALVVERKVLFLAVVKEQGNEGAIEVGAAIGHNEDLWVVVNILVEKCALVVERRKVAISALVERKVMLVAVVKEQGNVGVPMEVATSHNEDQEMVVSLVAETAALE